MVGTTLPITLKISRRYKMQITTLMNLHKRLYYLEEEATLSELLEFLGMRYFEGSRKEGNEDHDFLSL